jgi:hypothetical protein
MISSDGLNGTAGEFIQNLIESEPFAPISSVNVGNQAPLPPRQHSTLGLPERGSQFSCAQ